MYDYIYRITIRGSSVIDLMPVFYNFLTLKTTFTFSC